jgi:hypothetical protein
MHLPVVDDALVIAALAVIAVIGLLVGFALWAVAGETSGKAGDRTDITRGGGDYGSGPDPS